MLITKRCPPRTWPGLAAGAGGWRGDQMDIIMMHDSFVKDQLLDSDMRIVCSCTSIMKQGQCRQSIFC